jgi:pimeloyl-ACP methyl ester carboxylesterase
LSEVHSGLAQLGSKPTFIAWAMKDIAFLPSYLDDLWLSDFPQAEVLRLPDAGHYLQEDAVLFSQSQIVRASSNLH